MKYFCLAAVVFLGFAIFGMMNWPNDEANSDTVDKKLMPSQAAAWRWSFPDASWSSLDAEWAAQDVKAWRMKLAATQNTRSSEQGVWRLEGPTNIGGRLNFFRQHPLDSDLQYAGSAAGGLWTSPGLGGGQGGENTWTTRTDGLDYLAMGSIAFHPTDTNLIYLGTGDPQISSHPRVGGGVFKSEDRGQSWIYSGCGEGKIISRLLVLKSTPDTVLAAAMGNPAFDDGHRGIYRTTNGGADWEQTLAPESGLGPGTGVNDLVQSDSTETIVAAAWTRQRTSWSSVVSGVDCRLHRSTDSGETWAPIENPWPEAAQGRIGLTQTGGIFWALVVNVDNQLGQVYRSNDDGLSWSALIAENGIEEGALGGFGWYFSKIVVNPWNPDDLTILGVDLWNSLDGGAYWTRMAPEWWYYSVHADKHDFQWTGAESGVLATDGGAYQTFDHGENWQDIEDLPITQFYRATANPHVSGQLTGGAQDNGTMSGSHLEIGSWTRDRGGDGFTAAYHPVDQNLRYATVQWGNFAFSTSSSLEPFPAWQSLSTGFSGEERFYWDSPLMIHPANPDRLWCAAEKVFTMTDPPYGTWIAVSADLTSGAEDPDIPGLNWRSVTALGGSHFDENVVAAGTSDGHLWLTIDGGATWTSMGEGLPNRYVTDVVFDPFHADSMFCTVSGYRDAIYTPHVFKAALGSPWSDISGDLPDHPANAIEPLNDSIWVLATDFGVYLTRNYGVNWMPIAPGDGPGLMPMIPVYDLAVDLDPGADSASAERLLVAATYARSLHSFPFDSLVPINAPDPGSDSTDQVLEPGIKESFDLVAYPSPFVDQIIVELEAGQRWTTLEVLDGAGRLVERQAGGQTARFETTNWPAGVYFLRAKLEDGSSAALKVLKR